ANEIQKVLQFAASFFAFGLTYKTLNGSILSWRSAFFGGFWAAIGFEFVKHLLLLTLTPATLNFAQPIAAFLYFSIILCIGLVFCSAALVFGNLVCYVDQFRHILEEMEVPHRRSEPRPT